MDVEKTLEFDKLKGILSEYAVSDPGRRRVADLHPLEDIETIRYQLSLCTEAVEAIQTHGYLPLEGLVDIGEILARLRVSGSVLEPDEFLMIHQVAEVNERVRAYFSQFKEGFAVNLVRLAGNLPRLDQVVAEISRRISPEGEILESASPELRRIRRQLNRTRESIRRQLEDLITSSDNQHMIQDRIITLRNNRFVIPLKQEYRSSFQGVVQDFSASGATVFVEPMAVVELNNTLHQLAASEKREIVRILAELTGLIREFADDLASSFQLLGLLDFIGAKARFSIDYRCSEPVINDDGVLHVEEARHPVLAYNLRRKNHDPSMPREVVPIDVEIGTDFDTLVITGPNTGGKTVALKTVGLLSLMALSGMHIPARDKSRIPLWSNIFVDIGDEQSIEQNLSTFSSHIARIVEIIEKADDRSLVLVDEIGAGTDPAEGAALGMALLDYFHSIGARTIATTHHSIIKIHAHEQPGMENASVQFDAETLQPTYELRIGVPGSSNALKIASRLNVPESILEKARDYLSSEAMAVEDMLAEMEEERRKLQHERQELSRQLEAARRAAEIHEARVREIERDRKKLMEEAAQEAARIVGDARRVIERCVHDIRQNQASRESIKRAHETIDRLQSSIARSRRKPKLHPYKIGDLVNIRSLGTVGKVLTVRDDRDEALLRVGGMEIAVPIAELEPLKPEDRREDIAPEVIKMKLQKRTSVSPEINLLGCTGDEARSRLDKYLDDVFLAGLSEVRVVHGLGTGVLRNVVREMLIGHPHVETFRSGKRSEGGDGVTMVKIKLD